MPWIGTLPVPTETRFFSAILIAIGYFPQGNLTNTTLELAFLTKIPTSLPFHLRLIFLIMTARLPTFVIG